MGSVKPGPLPPQRKSATDSDLPLGGFNPPTPWPSPAPSMPKPAQPRILGSLGASLAGGLHQSAVPMISRSLLEPTAPLTQPPPRAGTQTIGPGLMPPAAAKPATQKQTSQAPITWAPLAEKPTPKCVAVDHAAHRNAVITSTFDNRDKVMARINEAYDDDPRLASHYRQILAMDSPKERKAYAARNLPPLPAEAAPVEDATEARKNQAPYTGKRETLTDTGLPSWREGVERASGYRLTEASDRKAPAGVETVEDAASPPGTPKPLSEDAAKHLAENLRDAYASNDPKRIEAAHTALNAYSKEDRWHVEMSAGKDPDSGIRRDAARISGYLKEDPTQADRGAVGDRLMTMLDTLKTDNPDRYRRVMREVQRGDREGFRMARFEREMRDRFSSGWITQKEWDVMQQRLDTTFAGERYADFRERMGKAIGTMRMHVLDPDSIPYYESEGLARAGAKFKLARDLGLPASIAGEAATATRHPVLAPAGAAAGAVTGIITERAGRSYDAVVKELSKRYDVANRNRDYSTRKKLGSLLKSLGVSPGKAPDGRGA